MIIIGGISVFMIAPFLQSFMKGPQWLQVQTKNSVVDVIGVLTPKKIILAQNVNLKNEIESYKAQLFELQLLRDENMQLRTEVSYIQDPSSIIFARVLAKPSRSLYNSIIIDQGSKDGIMLGQMVVTRGVLGLGSISSVSENTATVELFSGPQFSSNLVMKNQNITVPAKGRGGGNFEIHIPREIVVTDGDILALPEDPNIAVGVVKSITFDPRDPFQTILARTPINLQELNFVEVVK